MKTKDIKDKLKKKKTKKDKPLYLSTGSTLLNLACSGKVQGGFRAGKYYFLVGDSASGKTFLSLTCLAEAGINPAFGDYRFIYDNSEDGALMDIKKFFGPAVSRRMEAPSTEKDGTPTYSSSIEEFYFHIDDAFSVGKPFIYILDSMDSLTTEDEGKKFDEHKKAHRKGKQAKGSYGDGKAKKNSTNLRRLLTPLKKSNSILIVISQTRDNLGFGFETKTRSGGRSLRFYATLEIWSSIKGKITKGVKGKIRQLGIKCLCKIKKNRMTGKESSVVIPIYHSYGIDNIGGCIDYLIEEDHWDVAGKKINAVEFGVALTADKLIAYIEENEKEYELHKIVGTVWKEIEEACAVKRKQKYK